MFILGSSTLFWKLKFYFIFVIKKLNSFQCFNKTRESKSKSICESTWLLQQTRSASYFSQISRFNRKFHEYKYFLAKNHYQVKYQPTIASNKVNIILVQLPSIKCLPASKWECAKDEKDKIFMEKVMWVHLKVFCDFVCHYLFYIFHFHMPIETINSTHMSWTHLLMRAVLSLIFLDRKAKISRKREKNWSMCVRKIIFFSSNHHFDFIE